MYRLSAHERPVSKYKSTIPQNDEPHSWTSCHSDTIYGGVSGFTELLGPKLAIALSNSTYMVDYLEYEAKDPGLEIQSSDFCDSIIAELKQYSRTHAEKIVALAMPKVLDDRFPDFCPRLWMELDCIPIVLEQHCKPRQQADQGNLFTFLGWDQKPLDEQADSMMRKCVRFFGVGNLPHFELGSRSLLEIDDGFRIHLMNAKDFENSVKPHIWSLVQHYAEDLKRRRVKLAVFSATPHNREIESGRTALLRLGHILQIDTRWYTPQPSPRVFRAVEKLQNLLLGSSIPGESLTTDEKLQLRSWVHRNARHHWLSHGGPLRPRQSGGVDVVIISDPSLAELAFISKQEDPNRPVIFNSRINICKSPLGMASNPQDETFNFIWSTLSHADVLACQAPSKLDSPLIPQRKVGYVMASVDRFHEVTKDMTDRDFAFYGSQFNASCRVSNTATIDFPNDKYILVQVSHLPSMPQPLSVLKAYRTFLNLLKAHSPATSPPKLVFSEHQASRNRNESFFDSLTSHIMQDMHDLRGLICVKQIRYPDQLWNTLISNSNAVIILPDNEDFEERFLQALQKGKPIIRTRPLGPYSFLQNEGDIYIVAENDSQAMAESLLKIETAVEGSRQRNGPSLHENWDQVTTVGTAVSWLYLASVLSKGEKVEPNGEYIHHLADKA